MFEFSPAHVPEYYNFAEDVIDRWAEDAKKTALHWVDRNGENERLVTFAEIRDRSRALGSALSGAGLGPGDRVVIVIGREPEWWFAMMGLIRAGVVAVPGTTLLTPKDFKFRIKLGGVSGVLVDSAGAE